MRLSMTTAAECCDFILFGTQGDLARRKLLPALYQLEKSGILTADSKVIGVARESMSKEAFVASVRESLTKFVTKEQIDDAVWQRFAAKLNYVAIDLANLDEYEALSALPEPTTRAAISYFATPPALFPTICEGLAKVGLNQPTSRVVLEK